MRPTDERGTAAAEAVIVLPVLLFVVLTVVQFGVWYHAVAVAKAAVAEAARAARAEGGTAEDGRVRGEAFLAQAGSTVVERPEIVVSRDAEVVRVELHAVAANVVPGVHLPIHAFARSVVERFRPDLDPT